MSDTDEMVIASIAAARNQLVAVINSAGRAGYAIKVDVAEAYTAHGPSVPESFQNGFGILVYRPIGNID